LETNKIYCGNTLEVLKTFPSESINCCVTSPPYWALRDYGTDGVVWDGDPECEHEWGTSIKNDKNWRGGTTNPKISPKMSIKGKTNFAEVPISYSNFCIHCGAWKGQLGLEPDFNTTTLKEKAEAGYSKCQCNAPFRSGIVLDPFMGAGTTALVALKQNKQFVGIEINPKYVEMAYERIRPLLQQSKLSEKELVCHV